MNLIDKTSLLHKVELFQNVKIESLQAIAEVSELRDMAKDEVIFKDGDESDRFYCIVSGKVSIKKHGKILAELSDNDYFGELGLLDDSVRAADAIASHDGILLYIEKDDFNRILQDLPQMMRTVIKQILKYLRFNTLKNGKKPHIAA